MRAQTISRQLYEVNGFRGAKQNYYDPDNSCINKVRLTARDSDRSMVGSWSHLLDPRLSVSVHGHPSIPRLSGKPFEGAQCAAVLLTWLAPVRC